MDSNYIEKWKLDGGKTAFYKCPHCLAKIEIIAPRKKEVDSRGYWDSLTICPKCNKLSFVIVYPSLKTKVIKLLK